MLSKLRFNTTIFKKLLMAVTGLAMCLFLVGHLAGNLQLLWNKGQFDAYANFLTIGMAPVVIVMELGLLAILALHVVDALVLLKGNYAARPIGYQKKTWGRTKSKKSKKSWASTMMMWTGMTTLLFIVFHVWQMKYHNPVASKAVGTGHNSNIVLFPGAPTVAQPSVGENAGKEVFSLAQLVVNELQNPIVAGIYVLALVLLGFHLWHAVSSALTSVGGNHPRFQKLIMWAGNAFTIVIIGGFLSIPVLILARVIK